MSFYPIHMHASIFHSLLTFKNHVSMCQHLQYNSNHIMPVYMEYYLYTQILNKTVWGYKKGAARINSTTELYLMWLVKDKDRYQKDWITMISIIKPELTSSCSQVDQDPWCWVMWPRKTTHTTTESPTCTASVKLYFSVVSRWSVTNLKSTACGNGCILFVVFLVKFFDLWVHCSGAHKIIVQLKHNSTF